MKILIIPEDPTLDRHVLKPLAERLLLDIGVSGRVDVLEDPHLRGVDEALDPDTVAAIIRDNPMEDLFLLMIDRDCDRFQNSARAQARETEHTGKLLACLAQEEVEVWMLGLHRESLDAGWSDVRAECDPKEAFAEPFLDSQGWTGSVGRGRKRAMRDLGTRWQGLIAVCPELADLKERLAGWVADRQAAQ